MQYAHALCSRKGDSYFRRGGDKRTETDAINFFCPEPIFVDAKCGKVLMRRFEIPNYTRYLHVNNDQYYVAFSL